MAEQFTSYEVDHDRSFARAIDRALKVTEDLTVPLTLISKDFYRSEKAIFMLSGPGGYPDLAQSTKEKKIKAVGTAYPILLGVGKTRGSLMRSLTEPTDTNAVNLIVNKNVLIIGTEVAYGVYHQSDRPRTKIPLRKFLFIGPESRFANSDQQGRVGRWLNIMNDFILKKLKGAG